jgi:DNA-binding NtrC family response regulator
MGSTKRCLMIVEDEPELRAILREWIEDDLNCEVIEAENGIEALDIYTKRKLQLDPVDAILSDIDMPKMNGLKLLEKIRESDSMLPFVILSAHGNQENLVLALRLGAYEFLEKPYEEKKLLNTVEEALELGFSFRGLEEELEAMTAGINLTPEEAKKYKDIKRQLLISKRKFGVS